MQTAICGCSIPAAKDVSRGAAESFENLADLGLVEGLFAIVAISVGNLVFSEQGDRLAAGASRLLADELHHGRGRNTQKQRRPAGAERLAIDSAGALFVDGRLPAQHVLLPRGGRGQTAETRLKGAPLGTGEVEFETVGDGDTRRFAGGDILHLQDITGEGHMTRVVGEDELLIAVVQEA